MIIKLHMKSGKTLVQKGVSDYTIRYQGNEITYLSLSIYWFCRRTLVVGSLDLSQIEAIEIIKHFGRW